MSTGTPVSASARTLSELLVEELIEHPKVQIWLSSERLHVLGPRDRDEQTFRVRRRLPQLVSLLWGNRAVAQALEEEEGSARLRAHRIDRPEVRIGVVEHGCCGFDAPVEKGWEMAVFRQARVKEGSELGVGTVDHESADVT